MHSTVQLGGRAVSTIYIGLTEAVRKCVTQRTDHPSHHSMIIRKSIIQDIFLSCKIVSS